MASTSRGGGSGAGSFLDLKAEISKKKEEYRVSKAAGVSYAKRLKLKGIGAVKNTSKWDRPNKGVHSRSQRDIELEEISKPTLESARTALERKAKLYEKLKKGKTGGLSERQYDELLVDFDNASGSGFESDSDDVDESATVPRLPVDESNDPIVEYEDEFGRMRTARRSEIPRHLAQRSPEPEPPELDPHVIYGDQNFFPTYEPSEDRVREIEEKLAADTAPPTAHFDASQDNRARGAAFYQFSADEELRKKQMEDLQKAREETQQKRAELGEFSEDHSGEKPVLSGRGIEKRKREIEERRKAIEAKRRKKGDSGQATSNEPSRPKESLTLDRSAADDFLASLEADLMK